MTFVIETKLPDYQNWYSVIDSTKSTVHPKPKLFATENQATEWAKQNVPSNQEWRVVEHEVQ